MAKSVAELIAHARANPDKLSYATSTQSEYLAAAQFMKATGISMVRVPYKGGPQALPDLLSGRVEVNFGPLPSALPYLKSGQLRMLATLLSQRDPSLPDIPTIAEAGVPSVSVSTWQAIFAPPGTPSDIADRLSRDVRSALREPGVQAAFVKYTIRPEGSTPEMLAASIVEEQRNWSQFVRDNRILPE